MLVIAFLILIIFLVAGVPVVFAIGISGLLAVVFGSDVPLFILVQRIVGSLNSFPLLAAPLFLLAGELMGKGGMSKRIVTFSTALVGHLKGGLAIVCVVASMIFAGISGSGAANASAIGAITLPQLKEKGYSRGFSGALISASCAIGPIIPPSLNVIIYASVTGDSVGKMFLGGIMPGFIIGLFLMLMSYWYANKHGIDTGGQFSLIEIIRAFKGAAWALFAPLVIVGGIIFGVFTATEAGIIAILYSIFCGVFVYRELTLKRLYESFYDATNTTGMIMMIMGIASIYGYIFAIENVGASIAVLLTSISTNPYIILILIVFIVLILGCFMEMIAVMIVVAPILRPIIINLGIDPIHFGVIFCVGTVVGAITPPVGIYLYIAMGLAKAKMSELMPYVIPTIVIMIVTLLIMIFIPQTVTFFPSLLMK